MVLRHIVNEDGCGGLLPHLHILAQVHMVLCLITTCVCAVSLVLCRTATQYPGWQWDGYQWVAVATPTTATGAAATTAAAQPAAAAPAVAAAAAPYPAQQQQGYNQAAYGQQYGQQAQVRLCGVWWWYARGTRCFWRASRGVP